MAVILTGYIYDESDVKRVLQKIIIGDKLYIVYLSDDYPQSGRYYLNIKVYDVNTLLPLERYTIFTANKNNNFLIFFLITPTYCYLLEKDALFKFNSFEDFIEQKPSKSKYLVEFKNIALNGVNEKNGYWTLINKAKYLLEINGNIYACSYYDGNIIIQNLYGKKAYTYNINNHDAYGEVYAYVKNNNIIIIKGKLILEFDVDNINIKTIDNDIEINGSFYDYFRNEYILNFFRVKNSDNLFINSNKIIISERNRLSKIKDKNENVLFKSSISNIHKYIPLNVLVGRTILFERENDIFEIEDPIFEYINYYYNFIENGNVDTNYLYEILNICLYLGDIDTSYIALFIVNYCIGKNDLQLSVEYLKVLYELNIKQFFVLLLNAIYSDNDKNDIEYIINDNQFVNKINKYLNVITITYDVDIKV